MSLVVLLAAMVPVMAATSSVPVMPIGAAGAVASMVRLMAGLGALSLPAASVSV